jgi:SAM-dependent methyltransferase
MKPIEPAQTPSVPGMTRKIRDFWTRNVNAERLFGQQVSQHPRGEEAYFQDLETQRYRSHRHLLPWIATMRAPATVLEIGCGIGLDSYTIARQGLDLVAVDLTEVGVRTASQRFAHNALAGAFAVANAEDLPFPDNHFDYVYSFGVLHHADDTERCIREVHRVLRPGGEARIMLYNRHSLNEVMHRLLRVPFEERDELCPVVRRFDRRELLAMFAPFSRVDLGIEYLFGEGYGAVYRLMPRWLYDPLSHRIGWHWMIAARK